VARKRLVEPGVGGRELILGDYLGVDLVTAADELDEGDLLACEPSARGFESDQLRLEPRLDAFIENASCVVPDRGVRRRMLGLDSRS
jgi:hypothetical protein